MQRHLKASLVLSSVSLAVLASVAPTHADPALCRVIDVKFTPQGLPAVFDTGGGSSQFTFGSGSRVDERFSVEVGAVKYTDYAIGRFIEMAQRQQESLRKNSSSS